MAKRRKRRRGLGATAEKHAERARDAVARTAEKIATVNAALDRGQCKLAFNQFSITVASFTKAWDNYMDGDQTRASDLGSKLFGLKDDLFARLQPRMSECICPTKRSLPGLKRKRS